MPFHIHEYITCTVEQEKSWFSEVLSLT